MKKLFDRSFYDLFRLSAAYAIKTNSITAKGSRLFQYDPEQFSRSQFEERRESCTASKIPLAGFSGKLKKPQKTAAFFKMSGKRESNPRRQPWQGCTLPLSYSRVVSCERRDLNPHSVRNQILSLACLPVPPRSRQLRAKCQYTAFTSIFFCPHILKNSQNKDVIAILHNSVISIDI
jgi:hypothetical protein